MAQTETEYINAARKTHHCSWCGELIEAGQSYCRYRWFDCGDVGTVKMHPECIKALDKVVSQEGGVVYFNPGDSPRGCSCGGSGECDTCSSKGEEPWQK